MGSPQVYILLFILSEKHKLLVSCIVMHHAYDSEVKGGCGGWLEIWEFGYDLRDHVFDPLYITSLSVVLNPKSAWLLNIRVSVSYMQKLNTSPSVTRSLGLAVLNK